MEKESLLVKTKEIFPTSKNKCLIIYNSILLMAFIDMLGEFEL